MEELIQRIVASVGIDEETAQTAISTIMNLLNNEGDSDLMSQITGAIPGAEEYISGDGEGGGAGGLLGGIMSAVGGSTGGALAALGSLKASGVGMGEAQGIASELVSFAREKAGDDVVDQLLESVPGVSQFFGGGE